MRQPRVTSAGRVLLWITLIAGFLLLSIAAGLRADARDLAGSAVRRQDFTASGSLRSLTIESLNGTVRIVAGPAFKATVDLTARAETDREARRILDGTECRFTNEDGHLDLLVEPPGTRMRHSRGGWDVHTKSADAGRVDARVEVTLPPEVRIEVSVVNGGVSTKGISAGQKLSTVNGKIEVAGAKQGLELHSVNGNVEAAVAELLKGAELDLKSVSGNLVLAIPAGAGFRFEGRTLSGDIVSTFPLPARADAGGEIRVEREKLAAEKEKLAAERARVREAAREGAPPEDLAELNRSLADMSRDLARMGADIARQVTVTLNRSYGGTVGGGGAVIRMSNLSGKISLLAEGTTESQAKPLLPPRRAKVMEAAPVVAPATLAPPVLAVPPRLPRLAGVPPPPAPGPEPPEPPEPPEAPDLDRSIHRGDVEGDFTATDVQGDVRLGRVSGKVKVATQWGEIHVASAGKGADLSSAGGEIVVDSVTGDLSVTTMGGDISAGRVSGDVRLETAGGDIVLKSGGGSVVARTTGGDVTLRRVRGPVRAGTQGGTVICEIVSAEKPGVEIATGGGDVTLVLPANYKGDVDVRVTGVDAEGDYILSQFPDIAVVKQEGLQKAEGKLGGGGPKIIVRTAAGSVRIRRGPAAP